MLEIEFGIKFEWTGGEVFCYRLGMAKTKQTVRPFEKRDAAAKALVVRIRAAGLAKAVLGRYNGSQGNADVDAPEGSEAYEWAQHDHAVEQVYLLLGERGLLVETDTEETVSDAFTELT